MIVIKLGAFLSCMHHNCPTAEELRSMPINGAKNNHKPGAGANN